MIARIHGTVVETFDKGVIVDVSGIGYAVYTTKPLVPGTEATLHTHFVIRDDAHELYGFEHADEKSLFSILIGVSGVGPKTALQMLTLYSLPQLVLAIRTGDAKTIALVPGIGKKTAEKVVIDLKDKLTQFTATEARADSDLIEALLSLGYKEYQIRAIATAVDTTLPIEKQIGHALQLLQK